MPTVVSNIQSTNWQLSTAGFGIVAEGLEDIRQCLDIILRTPKGQDSFRPEFGSDIYQYIDFPVPVAIANITRAIIEAVDIWEKRVKLVSIKHYIEVEHITFVITYQLIDQDVIDSLQLTTGAGYGVVVSPPGALILEAFFPPNPTGKKYNINLVLDNAQVLPVPPSVGFNTLNGLYDWIKNNLSHVGRWKMLVDRFVLYTSAGVYKTGSVAIELLKGINTFRQLLPVLDIDEFYHFDMTLTQVNGSTLSIELPDGTCNTKGELLSALTNDYSHLGTWSIIPGSTDLQGDFSQLDFSDDFFNNTELYYIQLESNIVQSATINVTAI